MLIVCLKGIAWPQGTPDSRNRFGVSYHPIMNRTPYPSDLNGAEWQLLEPLPPPKPGGRPIKYPRREIVNAIRYILRTGAA